MSISIGQILVFLIHFLLCYSSSREPSNIFIWIFNYLSFKKFKVIPALASEVQHTVASTFLSAYAYLYVTWLTFVLKVAIMSINGCGNLNYWGSLLINRNINRNEQMNLLGYMNILVTANAHIHTYTETYTNSSYI